MHLEHKTKAIYDKADQQKETEQTSRKMECESYSSACESTNWVANMR